MTVPTAPVITPTQKQSHSSTMRLNPKKNQPKQDIVYTPEPLAIDIINHYNSQILGTVLDPCMGDGVFYDNFPTAVKDWCEVDKGKDFLDYNKNVDWIISNPPWSKMRQFLQHAMTIANDIVFLTSVNHYTTKARIRSIALIHRKSSRSLAFN